MVESAEYPNIDPIVFSRMVLNMLAKLRDQGVPIYDLVHRVPRDSWFCEAVARSIINVMQPAQVDDVHPNTRVRIVLSAAGIPREELRAEGEFQRIYPVYHRAMTVRGFRELVDGFDDLELKCLLGLYGATDGRISDHKAVAESLGITVARCRRRVGSAMAKIRHRLNEWKFIEEIDPLDSPEDWSLYALGLQEQTLTVLSRAQINSVGELLRKTEDDLLAITNFSSHGLLDVLTRLKRFGLKLADG